MKAALKKLIQKVEDRLDQNEDRLLNLVSDEAIEHAEDKQAKLEELLGLLEEALGVLEDE